MFRKVSGQAPNTEQSRVPSTVEVLRRLTSRFSPRKPHYVSNKLRGVAENHMSPAMSKGAGVGGFRSPQVYPEPLRWAEPSPLNIRGMFPHLQRQTPPSLIFPPGIKSGVEFPSLGKPWSVYSP